MSNPVYLIAQVDVKDQQRYMEEYGSQCLRQFEEIGAEVLAGSPETQVLEGDWSGNWTAIVKFPSAEIAKQWYNSSEYGVLKTARIERLSNSGTVVLVPGQNADP